MSGIFFKLLGAAFGTAVKVDPFLSGTIVGTIDAIYGSKEERRKSAELQDDIDSLEQEIRYLKNQARSKSKRSNQNEQ